VLKIVKSLIVFELVCQVLLPGNVLKNHLFGQLLKQQINPLHKLANRGVFDFEKTIELLNHQIRIDFEVDDLNCLPVKWRGNELFKGIDYSLVFGFIIGTVLQFYPVLFESGARLRLNNKHGVPPTGIATGCTISEHD